VTKAFPLGRTGNRLLNLLPPAEYRQLEPLLHKVKLVTNHQLYEPRQEIEEIYWPISAVLSAVTVMSDGHAIEVATVGNEGVSGLPAFNVIATSPHRVFSQVAGDAWRISAADLIRQNKELEKLRVILTNYHHAFMFQVSQSVACNGLHVLAERCCRWLLMTHDRVEGDNLPLTHEFLSYMLGVRRSGVTEVLLAIQQQEHIRYRNGMITVVNREGLEKMSCECHGHIQDEYNRLLGSGISD
jgi:hypothetical protein